MNDLPDIASLRAVLDQPLEPKLHKLLENRLSDTLHCGLEAHTHILVIEGDDAEAQVVDAVGFSPLRSRTDDKSDEPDWDWIEAHDGWFELLYCVGNSGFAYILLIEDSDGSEIAAVCRKFARCG